MWIRWSVPDRPQSSRTVARTQALLVKVAAMCSGAAKQSREGVPAVARAPASTSTRTIAQVRELVASTLPAAVSLQVEAASRTLRDAQTRRTCSASCSIFCTTPRPSRAGRVAPHHPGDARTRRRHGGDQGVGRRTRRAGSRCASGCSSAATRTTGGSGHGLAIARELAERNGGTLKLADVPRKARRSWWRCRSTHSAIDRVATLYGARERLFSPRAAERGRSEHVAA